ncbi:hypothetical protein BCR33DRAFT_97270 [Rhizoclosmatium globosum]|uniref:Uncharacterized protein n=1 Tax=Rhizoclosmatium globosum TaxID=329046 RepID=A0A1Y2CKF0_9FUNG|nr:hypothetical protein BCR33DRAFT_97270 [Rhizoclosmatium globosum]|eukprot:ORY47437.1 hypothetical protein BCR33DRAFT_97270 [Rhizoclosmatium globosum]
MSETSKRRTRASTTAINEQVSSKNVQLGKASGLQRVVSSLSDTVSAAVDVIGEVVSTVLGGQKRKAREMQDVSKLSVKPKKSSQALPKWFHKTDTESNSDCSNINHDSDSDQEDESDSDSEQGWSETDEDILNEKNRKDEQEVVEVLEKVVDADTVETGPKRRGKGKGPKSINPANDSNLPVQVEEPVIIFVLPDKKLLERFPECVNPREGIRRRNEMMILHKYIQTTNGLLSGHQSKLHVIVIYLNGHKLYTPMEKDLIMSYPTMNLATKSQLDSVISYCLNQMMIPGLSNYLTMRLAVVRYAEYMEEEITELKLTRLGLVEQEKSVGFVDDLILEFSKYLTQPDADFQGKAFVKRFGSKPMSHCSSQTNNGPKGIRQQRQRANLLSFSSNQWLSV